MTFCKTSQFPRKRICDGVPFGKDVSPLVCNCTKTDAFTSVFLWIDKTQIFLVHFIQASSRICSTGLFKNFGKLAGKRLFRIFFLIVVHHQASNFIKKRVHSSDVLLWILRNCFKHLFYRTPPVSVSHFNSTFLTLSLRRTYIYIFQALLGFRYF